MNARASENYLAISRSSSASKSVEIFGPRYIGDDFFLGSNLVSFNRAVVPLNRNENGRFGALKSDSTHHFFRNASTKSGSLRFSQFSGC